MPESPTLAPWRPTPGAAATPVGPAEPAPLHSVGHDDVALRSRSSLVLVVFTIGLVGAVVPLAIASHFGALGIPRNDDWAYLRALFEFDAHGTLDGGHWISANLVGQLLASMPAVWIFGRTIRGFQILTAFVGVAGLFAVFDLARRRTSITRALFASLVVAVGPLWGNLAVSYMTDVPAFTCAMVCLALGARGIQRREVRPAFFVALAVGAVGFTIREYAVAAPIAVVVTAVWASPRWSRADRRATRWAAFACIATMVAFYTWRLGLPTWYESSVSLPPASELASVFDDLGLAAIVVGLLVVPATILARPVRTVTAARQCAPRASVAAFTVTVAWLVFVIVHHFDKGVFVGFVDGGSYLTMNGAVGSSTLYGERGMLLPQGVLVALAIIGALSAVVVVAHAIRAFTATRRTLRRRTSLSTQAIPQVLVGVAILGYVASFVASRSLGIGVFDRYLLPVVPLVVVIMLWRAPSTERLPRRTTATALGAMLVLATVGLVFAMNGASFDGTKWRLADRAETVGGNPAAVDGGYEWFGMHGLFSQGADYRSNTCVHVESSATRPRLTADVIAMEPVWGVGGPQAWITARRVRPC